MQRSIICAMSRWLHRTEYCRGATGRSAAFTAPMRRQMHGQAVRVGAVAGEGLPQTLLAP